MADDFSQCMVGNSRMAARAITRRYDAYLRPYGLSATQLSLMQSIHERPDATVSELAEARAFERTTLTRNLDRLEAMGLVASSAGGGRTGRRSMLTPKALALMQELLPLWRKAQAELRQELSPDAFDSAVNLLKRLAKV